MSERESTMQLLLAVVAVNLLIAVVAIYGIAPDPIPGPIDDIALGVGAYQLASRTGLLQQVMGVIETLMKGGDHESR